MLEGPLKIPPPPPCIQDGIYSLYAKIQMRTRAWMLSRCHSGKKIIRVSSAADGGWNTTMFLVTLAPARTFVFYCQRANTKIYRKDTCSLSRSFVVRTLRFLVRMSRCKNVEKLSEKGPFYMFAFKMISFSSSTTCFFGQQKRWRYLS